MSDLLKTFVVVFSALIVIAVVAIAVALSIFYAWQWYPAVGVIVGIFWCSVWIAGFNYGVEHEEGPN